MPSAASGFARAPRRHGLVLELPDGRSVACELNRELTRVEWSDGWELFPELLAAGLVRAVHGGPGTYCHTDYAPVPCCFCGNVGWLRLVRDDDGTPTGAPMVVCADADDCTRRAGVHERPGVQQDRAARTGSCPRCGQSMIGSDRVCGHCRRLDREPQGEQVELFHAPAATAAPQPEGLF